MMDLNMNNPGTYQQRRDEKAAQDAAATVIQGRVRGRRAKKDVQVRRDLKVYWRGAVSKDVCAHGRGCASAAAMPQLPLCSV